MFEFLKATPAIEVANALWIHGVSDGSATHFLAETASKDNLLSDASVFDEAVYFMSFVTDLTIHRVFEGDARLEHALRQEFLDHARGYARYQQCTPCPVGDWPFDNSNIWEISSPGRDTGDPALHFLDRIFLYAAARKRPWEAGKAEPVAFIFCALCNKGPDAAFLLAATDVFVNHSINTQEFLRSIRVKS